MSVLIVGKTFSFSLVGALVQDGGNDDHHVFHLGYPRQEVGRDGGHGLVSEVTAREHMDDVAALFRVVHAGDVDDARGPLEL